MSEIAGRMGGTRDDRRDGMGATVEGDLISARWVRRHLASGVSVLTTTAENGYRGTTVSTCFVASIRPFQVGVSIERDMQMEDWVTSSGAFAVSILPWSGKLLADQFAGFTPLPLPTLAGIAHSTAVTGSPILSACIAWVDCAVSDTLTTGDHVLLIGDVREAGAGTSEHGPPLVYFDGRYLSLE